MNKTTLIVSVLVSLAVGGGAGYYAGITYGAPKAEETAEVQSNPLADVKTNPLEGVKSNPFEGVKTNPFE